MKIRIPKYYRKFLMKMGILMLIFSLCRLAFYWRNAANFPDAGSSEVIAGVWFDFVTSCLLFLPIAFIELFPNKNRKAKWFRILLALVTATILTFAIFINLVDVEYFSFTSARSTSALLVMMGFGSDLLNQIPSYFVDYWYIITFFVVLSIGAVFSLKRTYKTEDDSAKISLWKQLIYYLVTLGLCLFFARGGFVHKPIRPTEASKFTNSDNIPLVLNSAFTVINSWGYSSLEEKNYMTSEEANALFRPIHQYSGNERLNGQNICIIILESFSIEFINSLNLDDEDYTPFFDELVDSSLVFTNAFANGKKSIDAVPSIAASIPKLMNEEYLLSNYSVNQIESLPQHLGEIGYSSAFFHGATNGSMNFDAFCSLIGYDYYYGRTEYGNDEHFDGTWGIYDEEFLNWTVDRISELKKPFFSTVFTISSHPPFDLPERYKNEFQGAKSEMHRSIQYTDLALRKFFEKAKKQDWYDNTLFVLTADHTPGSSRRIYLHDRGKMNIPLIFYHPKDTFFRGKSERIVGHIDIMPTLLDLVGYHDPFFAFGHSVLDTVPGYTFSEVGNKKMLFEYTGIHPHVLIFQRETPVAMYHFKNLRQTQTHIQDKPEVVARMERRLKAIIQVYNHALLHNQMTVDRFAYP